VAQLEARAPQA